VGSVRSKDSKVRQPWRNSSGANEHSSSRESSLNHYAINGCARDSPTKPFDATSLKPPASPELMNQSAVAAGTRINTYPSRLGAHKTRRILRNDVLSQASEPVFFELDHLGKSTVLMALSWRQRLYQKGESGKGDTKIKLEARTVQLHSPIRDLPGSYDSWDDPQTQAHDTEQLALQFHIYLYCFTHEPLLIEARLIQNISG